MAERMPGAFGPRAMAVRLTQALLLWFGLLSGLVLAGGAIGAARADVIPIAVLSLREVSPGVFVMRWLRAPAVAQEAAAYAFYDVQVPEACVLAPPRLDCGAGGLVGTLRFAGLDSRRPGVVVRLTRQGGAAEVLTLTAANPEVHFASASTSGQSLSQIARIYTVVGVQHIWGGVDHLLFVFGLIWIVRAPRALLATISSFTVAHSFTLAAATLGWVGVPETPVNAAIALSIAFIGVEVVKVHRGQAGLTARYPWAVAFAFGLLHGFGFSQALTELGLPPDRIPWALLFFNVGVEIGQVAFVLLVLALGWAFRQMLLVPPRRAELVPAYAIGTLGMFWFIDRVVMFAGP